MQLTRQQSLPASGRLPKFDRAANPFSKFAPPSSMENSTAHTLDGRRAPPDRIILVYDVDSGFGAMLLDAAKKALGKEDCALCEMTHGPFGKREAWRRCESALGVIVDALHRNQIPAAWTISRTALPCILGRVGDQRPFVLVTRTEIEECGAELTALEHRLRSVLARFGGAR